MMQRTIYRRRDPANSSDEVVETSDTVTAPTRDIRSNMSGEVTESEIDSIEDIGTAIRTCRKHKVDYKHISDPDVSSLRRLLKLNLLCGGTTRMDIERKMIKGQNVEGPRMDKLCTLYREAHQLIKENSIVLSDLLKVFPTINKELEDHIDDLQQYRSPILVLGETGAGKTSFINLLLEQRLLPCSLLSNTHTICELSYSNAETLEAVVEYNDQSTTKYVRSTMDKKNRNDFVEFIKAEAVKENVRKIKIHGPFNILKNNVVIVDSPGVGESEAMTKVVLDYVEKAAAFIYVIDIMNAGGVQERMRLFIAEVTKRGTNCVKVHNAMFVCNKWDEVPNAEKKTVIQDTVKNVQQLWNGLDASQIIPFSSTEAQWIQDQKRAVSPQFGKVLDRLADLIPAAQCMSTLKAHAWLVKVLDKSLHITGTHIDNSRLSEKEIFQKKERAQQRLTEIEEKMEHVIAQQRERVGTAIQNEAVEMYARVTRDETRINICSFDEQSKLVKDKTWHDAAANIRTQLYERILKAMDLQTFVERQEDKIKEALALEIPSFESNLDAVQVRLSGRNPTGIEEMKTEFLPEYVRNVYGKSIGMTALLTPAMPFIALGRLPFFLFKRFKESRDMSAMEQQYIKADGRKDDIKKACQTYANFVFQHVVDKMEIKAISTESMQVCYGRLNELENEMKEVIDGEKKFIHGLPAKQTTIQSELKKIKGIEERLKCLKTRVDKLF